MQTQINFDSSLDFNKQLDIEDIGNLAIEAVNEDDGLYYYLLVFTRCGKTTIISYGPTIPDCEMLLGDFTFKYNTYKFNDEKIEKLISQWLNDRFKKIKAATIIDFETAISCCINTRDLIKTLIEDN